MSLFILGILLFLMGLEICKKCLKMLASKEFKKMIARSTDKLWSSILIGILATAVLQSSSALSIIIIGLIEANLIKFKPGMAVMFGANIGTTFTVQIISLPVLSFYPYLIISGVLLNILSIFTRKDLKKVGILIICFGVVFSGLNLMTEAFNKPEIHHLFINIIKGLNNNKYLGVLGGGMVTAMIQSSSAVTGLLVSLVSQDMISLHLAVAAAMGSNIGTCVTAFLASIKGTKSSISLAIGHFLFNLLGVIFFLFIFDFFIGLIKLTSVLPTRQLANAHSIFNIITLLIILPCFNSIVKILKPE